MKISALYFFCFLWFLTGCSTVQVLDRPYPAWGRQVNLPSADGSQVSHIQILIPEQDYPACILMVHGMNEHIGRYAESARLLAEKYLVAGLDLPGHGLSNQVIAKAHDAWQKEGGSQDISSAFLQQAAFSDLDAMRKDLEQAVRYLSTQCDKHSENNKSLPIFLLSHSLGSLVSASALQNWEDNVLQKRIQGVIFTGPAFSVTEVPGWRGWLQNPFIQLTYHNHQHFLHPHDEALPLLVFNQLTASLLTPLQDGLIEFLSLPGFRKLFSPATPDWVMNYLSNWDEERRRHNNDPFIIRRSVLRYVLTVEKEIIRFRRDMARFSTPYLIIFSEFDPITPAWGSQDFIEATLNNHPDNEVMMLAGENHHEQLFSTPKLRQRVFDKIEQWLARRIN